MISGWIYTVPICKDMAKFIIIIYKKMNCLPIEICRTIYELDPTFRNLFSMTVLPYLCSKIIFRGRLKGYTSNIEAFVILDETYAIVTDSLSTPTYRSVVFFHSTIERREYKTFFEWMEIIKTLPETVFFDNEEMSWAEFCQV
jgi:hypothetical protein